MAEQIIKGRYIDKKSVKFTFSWRYVLEICFLDIYLLYIYRYTGMSMVVCQRIITPF